ncbi:hypothetical protein [Streptomyces sp. NPDC050485]|uniref:Lsr2 family DNA-binding protein n=1 Tax=Streptomyces sp. NPDC050485 TaxID=3365617 RepID=UPI0037AD16D2
MTDPAEERVLRFLKRSQAPVRTSEILRGTAIKAATLRTMEARGLILSELVRIEEPGRPARMYRLPYGSLDPVDVRAYTVAKGLYDASDTSPVTLPEFRAYEAHLQHQERRAHADTARQRKEAADLRRQHRNDLVASWPHTKIPRVRRWAEHKGLDIGKRGRLPQWVMDKYDQEVDDQAELQSVLRNLGLLDDVNR